MTEINTTIGSRWMFKRRQAKLATPGNDGKPCLAGLIHCRSGQVFITEGKPRQGRNAALLSGSSGRPAEPPAAAVPHGSRGLRQ